MHGEKHSGDSHTQSWPETHRHRFTRQLSAGLDPDSHNRQKKQKHGIDNSNIGLLLVTGQQEEVLWFLSLMQLWWIVGD